MAKYPATPRYVVAVLLLLSAQLPRLIAEEPAINLGGLFEDGPSGRIEAFLDAIDYVNAHDILPSPFKLKGMVQHSSTSWGTSTSTCRLVNEGVVGIVSSVPSAPQAFSQSVAETFAVPTITSSATSMSLLGSKFLARTVPHDGYQGEAIADIVVHYGWRSIAVMFSDNDYGMGGLMAVQTACKMRNITVNASVALRRADVIAGDASYISAELSSLSHRGVMVFVVFASTEDSRFLYSIASEMNMMQSSYVWIGSSSSIHYDVIHHSESPSQLRGMIGVEYVTRFSSFPVDLTSEHVDDKDHAVARTFDSVLAFAYAIQSLHNNGVNVEEMVQSALDMHCSVEASEASSLFAYGGSLFDHLRQMTFEGLSGKVALDVTASRLPEFSIRNVQRAPLSTWATVSVGTWSLESGLELVEEVEWMGGVVEPPTDGQSIRNKTLSVLVKEANPFVFVDSSKKGKDQYTGFSMDFLRVLSKELDFEFVIHFSNSSTNEMIDEIAGRRYDIAIAAITITTARQKLVDFSQPYYDLGLKVVSRAPASKREANLLGVYRPFSVGLWLSLLLVVVVAAHIYWLCERRVNPFVSKSYVRGVPQSVWQIVTTLLQASQDTPRTKGAKVLSGSVFFFAVVLIASYTANLTSFLTSTVLVRDITGWSALLGQLAAGEVSPERVGVIGGGSVAAYYEREAPSLARTGSKGFPSLNAALEALESNEIDFAFYDSPLIEYGIKDRCTLEMRGETFNHQGYGIVLQKDSPFSEDVSSAVLRLKESGYANDLYEQWIRGNHGCAPTNENFQLNVWSMSGIFLNLSVAAFISLSLVIHREISHRRRSRHDHSKNVASDAHGGEGEPGVNSPASASLSGNGDDLHQLPYVEKEISEAIQNVFRRYQEEGMRPVEHQVVADAVSPFSKLELGSGGTTHLHDYTSKDSPVGGKANNHRSGAYRVSPDLDLDEMINSLSEQRLPSIKRLWRGGSTSPQQRHSPAAPQDHSYSTARASPLNPQRQHQRSAAKRDGGAV